MYACVKFICIRKLFTSVYAFITNIRCIGMDFILVCTCISYIYFEHPIVYMYMWVIYRCIYTCFMYVLISEVWFKSYMAPHSIKHTTTGLWSSGNVFCGVTNHASLFGSLVGLVDARRMLPACKFQWRRDTGMGLVFKAPYLQWRDIFMLRA